MPYVSHHSAEARTFDCLYDPNYIVPSERDVLHASLSAADSAAPVHVYPKYEVMFENAPKEMRLIFRKQQSLPTMAPTFVTEEDAGVQRLEGGANIANLPTSRKLQKVIASAGECKSKSTSSGLYLFRPYTTTDVNVINVQLSDSNTKIQPPGGRLRVRSAAGNLYQQCNNFKADVVSGAGGGSGVEGDQPKRKRIISKTRGTQTLYRESSAQTLPYLPDVSNEKDFLEKLELFRLPTILPGDGPPGLYEVEVLERARKRWAFNKALKDDFERQLKEAREQTKRPEHKHILEAFEWEQWIEREEYIQECQMLRLELLIRMFDKREKEMHDASKTRLAKRCEQIEAQREKALRKNEIEFGRDMRRLEIRRRKVPRNWRKENICDQLGQPDSEFYAPQMRYGVNPNRRHFAGGRKAFEARMDDLEKQAVNMGKLVCPYAKLKEWSKPKQQATEFEQNFCSDENLKKLYETMKNLREQSEKTRTTPKCLIEKFAHGGSAKNKGTSTKLGTDNQTTTDQTTGEANASARDKRKKKDPEKERRRKHEELQREAQAKRKRIHFLLDEKRREELEAMMADYEGSTIGWLMRFLSEEMDRLQEQRKLHFITMMAQRERWRREAAEAGLRQKENNMRQIYQQLYEETVESNGEIAGEYLDHILRAEIVDYAEDTATTSVLELARLIDEDIQRWLKSIHDIQTPLNFEALRYLLKNLIFPNAETLLRRYEAEQSVRYIIEDVLLPRVGRLLEPYDIGTAIAEEAVDRTIDNDLYYFTSQSECSTDCDLCPSEASCNCTPEKREAGALLRKLVRYVVPGRRWKTPDERVAFENVNDILDNAFQQLVCKGHFNEAPTGSLAEASAHTNIMARTPPNEKAQWWMSDTSEGELLHINVLDMENQRTPSTKVTRQLRAAEHLKYADPWRPSEESDVIHFTAYKQEERTGSFGYRQASAMKRIASTYDIMAIADDFLSAYNVNEPSSNDTTIYSNENIGNIVADETTKQYLTHLLNQMVKTVVPSEEGDSELSEFQVEEDQTENGDADSEPSSSEQFEDNPKGAVDYLIQNVLKAIPSEGDIDEDIYEQLEAEGIEEEQEDIEVVREEEEDAFMLEISEHELEMMNDKERCKCIEEQRREMYVRGFMQEGKVRIKPKSPPVEVIPEVIPESNKSLDMESIVTFEYHSISQLSPTENKINEQDNNEETFSLHPTTITENEQMEEEEDDDEFTPKPITTTTENDQMEQDAKKDETASHPSTTTNYEITAESVQNEQVIEVNEENEVTSAKPNEDEPAAVVKIEEPVEQAADEMLLEAVVEPEATVETETTIAPNENETSTIAVDAEAEATISEPEAAAAAVVVDELEAIEPPSPSVEAVQAEPTEDEQDVQEQHEMQHEPE